MKIAICDDNPSELEFISQLLKDYFTNHANYPVSIQSFSSAMVLTDHMNKHPVDLYFLDILMPGINGIELGQFIRERDTDAPIVYITSSPDFAVQSYSVHAMDYILKPFTADAFFCLMKRLDKYFQEKFYKHWIIKTAAGFYSVSCHEIMYIEYQEHRLNCYLSNGQIVRSSTLRISFDQAVAELMGDSRFLKVSAAFLVNMCCVTKMTANELIMKDKKTLTITRRYKEARKTYIDFILNGGA